MVDSAWNVLLVVVGFGLVIFIHELGHFIAARWAGIRVHAFALGFGPALCSWRKGLGFRFGSSEAELMAIRKHELEGIQQAGVSTARISETEYRLNVLPLGGYVRMLGQEDANPAAVSNAPDSYTSKPVWKRMVVVSAGVIMNVILAAVIFVGVFLHGIDEPPAMVGNVVPDSPAHAAGLRAGDVVTSIDGSPASTFLDLNVASALAGPNDTLRIGVNRLDGTHATLEVTPKEDPSTKIRTIGVEPAIGASIIAPRAKDPRTTKLFASILEGADLDGVRPGMALTTINGAPVPAQRVWRNQEIASALVLEDIAESSNGAPIALTFTDAQGEVEKTITPDPEFEVGVITVAGERRQVRHLAGLTPVMAVDTVQPDTGAERAGLRRGDILAKIGKVAWPAIGEGVAEIKKNAGKTIDLVVVRDGAMVPVTAEVSRAGAIGFIVGSGWSTPIVAKTPAFDAVESTDVAALRMPYQLLPGTRIDAIGTTPVSDWRSIRTVLRDATAVALASHSPAEIPLRITTLDPGSLDAGKAETVTMTLSAEEVARIHKLSWQVDRTLSAFEFAMFPYKASGPFDALKMGIGKTHRYMLMTYVTLQRLFQQTVKVEHLKGPVGIAHIGSQVAEQGIVHLLFFLGVISINLAVVNFLPLPIVDGGLFLMLVYEGIVRRPVPMVVQNALTVVGLVLIGSMFLIVTFNDITSLF